jgi:hypothetical protein
MRRHLIQATQCRSELEDFEKKICLTRRISQTSMHAMCTSYSYLGLRHRPASFFMHFIKPFIKCLSSCLMIPAVLCHLFTGTWQNEVLRYHGSLMPCPVKIRLRSVLCSQQCLRCKDHLSVTLDEIRCSSARRVRKPRLASQQT